MEPTFNYIIYSRLRVLNLGIKNCGLSAIQLLEHSG